MNFKVKKSNIVIVVAVHFLILLILQISSCSASNFNYFNLIEGLRTNEILYQWVNLAIRFFIFAVPALLLIKKYEKILPMSLKDLFISKPNLSNSLLSLFILIPYFLLALAIATGFKFNIRWENIGKFFNEHIKDFASINIFYAIIGAPFCEEIVFRGWIQNALTSKIKPIYAMIITNILFILIHFPGYILVTKDFPNPLSWCGVFLVGMLCSSSLYKNKNIFVPVLIHFINNFILVKLFEFCLNNIT